MFVSIPAKVHVMYVYSLYYARLMMYSRIAFPKQLGCSAGTAPTPLCNTPLWL